MSANNKRLKKEKKLKAAKVQGFCEQCGENIGRDRICPYFLELYNERIPVFICQSCFNERCDDI